MRVFLSSIVLCIAFSSTNVYLEKEQFLKICWTTDFGSYFRVIKKKVVNPLQVEFQISRCALTSVIIPEIELFDWLGCSTSVFLLQSLSSLCLGQKPVLVQNAQVSSSNLALAMMTIHLIAFYLWLKCPEVAQWVIYLKLYCLGPRILCDFS